MQYSSIQKPFSGRKSAFFVEGSRAWIPLRHKIKHSRAVAGATVPAAPVVTPVAASAPAAPAKAVVASATSSSSAPSAPPLRAESTSRPAVRPANPVPVTTGAIPHDCSDLVRRARGSFRHLAGMADTKHRLLCAGQDILAGLDGEPRNGILLHGEPGNGKTMFAEALAGELGIPFLSVAFGDMASKWINETPEKLRGLFRTARRCAPCVLFIDEVDSFLKPRDGASMGHSMDRDVVNTLLKEIVDLRSAQVVLVAATNFIEQLDHAAIRPGRFDFHIEVPAPDFQSRRYLIWVAIARYLGKEAVDRYVVDELARRWEGFSAARLAALGPQLRDMQRDGAFDGTITFDLATRAMRHIQGQRSTFPEHVVALEDIVMPEASRGMLTGLGDRLRNVWDFTQLGGTLPRGILFYGPPGTGKTMAAMSLAKESGWLFLSTTGTDLMARPDEWEKLVRRAKDQRPAIVFIDEAEPVLANRRHSNVPALTNRILATIDGTGGRTPDVIYIAATNHPDVLDPAVLRGGRFAMQVRFDVPADEDMRAWIETTLRERQADLELVMESEAEELAVMLLCGRPIADAQALIAEAISVSAARFLAGQEEEERVLSLEDMQAAARALGIGIGAGE
ncbi:AAA family ATPase [Paraburkholderia dinghuensis]|uniref:AAA family ATPase n=1 Tax=Paraburkholderia dinghuensis TaxID=2305225 RepID=A0A3N6MMQ2_9BURK|nr:AAA family ATPase [Paraburkholderia dinghuensis]RQH05009.1 AAA family ATPase [Paraburkholderia dinghuensis]